MLTAAQHLAQQSYTYSFVNAQSYLDEISRPLNKSHENNLITRQSASNSSNRAIAQAQMTLFGNLQNDHSFLNN